jgi:hypothetical protein
MKITVDSVEQQPSSSGWAKWLLPSFRAIELSCLEVTAVEFVKNSPPPALEPNADGFVPLTSVAVRFVDDKGEQLLEHVPLLDIERVLVEDVAVWAAFEFSFLTAIEFRYKPETAAYRARQAEGRHCSERIQIG